MHLAEMVALRAVPAAGLLLALTRRCPLHCAHCSTDSGPAVGADARLGGAALRSLVGSFTAADHPAVIFLSGGEPLLRPDLVSELARAARAAGTRTALLSGMFFARSARLPATIRRAVATLDHFSASLDEFHECEVPRERVFATLAAIMELVPAVSLHVASRDQTYVDALLARVRQRFGDRVPVLVTGVQPTGRGAALVGAASSADPGPCEFAGWPLVDTDGTVYACSRQSLARRHRSDHLVLGHARLDPWPRLRERALSQPTLRCVRAFGAVPTARWAGVPVGPSACQTCVTLPAQPPAGTMPSADVERVALRLAAARPPRQLARRWGAGDHADQVEAGWSACAG